MAGTIDKEEIIFDFSQNMVTTTNFTLTSAACDKLQEIQQQSTQIRLRVRVKAGGCSGFQYEFTLETLDEGAENKVAEQDFMIALQGVEVLVDKISASYLQDAQLDYAQNLAGESFQIINPNAMSSCGCGTSFSL